MVRAAPADVFDIGQVIEHGLCVGCGACRAGAGAAADAQAPVPVAMHWTPFELYEARWQATPDPAVRGALSPLCPFSDDAPDEDALAAALWPALPVNPLIGRHAGVGAGRVRDDAALRRSSSGGLTTYVLEQLLARGLVDGVLHVGDAQSDDEGAAADADAGTPGPLVAFRISTTAEQLRRNAKSRYHPVEMSQVLARIRGDGRRYALVGVPCFVKAARLLCRQDATLRAQLVFMIGLVCGHLKSAAFARSFAWQMGVTPTRVARFDFRVKDDQRGASAYAVAAEEAGSGRSVSAPSRSLFGSDWGLALFRPRACDFCDDIAGETADACFGDAWLPRFESDWRGTNIHVLRDARIAAILDDGARRGDIELFDASAEEFAASQAGNYRHRREGLDVRLADRRRARRPAPRKRRFAATPAAGLLRRLVYRARRALGERSHEAFRQALDAGHLDPFIATLRPLVRRYRLASLLASGRLLDHLRGALRRRLGRDRSVPST